MDGKELNDIAIPLVDDHEEHWVEVKISAAGNELMETFIVQ